MESDMLGQWPFGEHFSIRSALCVQMTDIVVDPLRDPSCVEAKREETTCESDRVVIDHMRAEVTWRTCFLF